jgi:hypothetical protein
LPPLHNSLQIFVNFKNLKIESLQTPPLDIGAHLAREMKKRAMRKLKFPFKNDEGEENSGAKRGAKQIIQF